MRNTWLYALPLALALITPMSASAAGRQPNAPNAADVPYAAAAAAAGTTLVFKDAPRPHGRVRGDTARLADSRACGVNADLDAPSDIPGFKKCMLSHGWRFTYAYQTPRASRDDSAPIDNSPASNNDDFWRTEQMINNQQMINDQQSAADQQTQSQQQLMNNQ